jgi:hypothetical protein
MKIRKKYLDELYIRTKMKNVENLIEKSELRKI